MASELIQRDMYAGKFHLIHNPTARGSSPRYKLVDDLSAKKPTIMSKPKGVTTLMGQTLAKDLTGWAVSCCVDELAEKLPLITQEDLDLAAKAYTRKRDTGANTGSEAHALVEQLLKTGAVDLSESSAEASLAFGAFRTWYEVTTPEILGVEEVIYSEQYDYAGTYDALMRIDGKVTLTDFKTTNPSRKAPQGIYAENFIQLGAYAGAHEEQRKYEEAHGGTKLEPIEDLMVLSGKKNGVFNAMSASELGLSVQDCIDMFHRVINLYNFLTFTTRALGGR
jgi:hypothetical protein